MAELNYPSNSNNKEEKRVEQVTVGKVVARKKGLGQKIKETFVEDTNQSVGDFLLFDVVIPTLKSLMMDMLTQGLERKFYGTTTPNRKRKGGSSRYVSYDDYYDRDKRTDRRGDRRELSRKARATHDFDQIVLESRGEAEHVLDRLGDLIEEYKQATVSDLYDLVGYTGEFTDDSWGWTSLRGARVVSQRDGYLLDMPRPEPID